jgi:hypothetical protein
MAVAQFRSSTSSNQSSKQMRYRWRPSFREHSAANADDVFPACARRASNLRHDQLFLLEFRPHPLRDLPDFEGAELPSKEKLLAEKCGDAGGMLRGLLDGLI